LQSPSFVVYYLLIFLEALIQCVLRRFVALFLRKLLAMRTRMPAKPRLFVAKNLSQIALAG